MGFTEDESAHAWRRARLSMRPYCRQERRAPMARWARAVARGAGPAGLRARAKPAAARAGVAALLRWPALVVAALQGPRSAPHARPCDARRAPTRGRVRPAPRATAAAARRESGQRALGLPERTARAARRRRSAP